MVDNVDVDALLDEFASEKTPSNGHDDGRGSSKHDRRDDRDDYHRDRHRRSRSPHRSSSSHHHDRYRDSRRDHGRNYRRDDHHRDHYRHDRGGHRGDYRRRDYGGGGGGRYDRGYDRGGGGGGRYRGSYERHDRHERHERAREEPESGLSAEDRKRSYERELRTILVSNVYIRLAEPEIKEWFEEHVGGVVSVKMIQDRGARRHKGIGYVEFEEMDSVMKALVLNGQMLGKQTVIIQPSQAERSRPIFDESELKKGPRFLFVAALPSVVDERDVTDLLEPFGKIASCRVEDLKESEGKERFAIVEFESHQPARRATLWLNGRDLGGMRVRIGMMADPKKKHELLAQFESGAMQAGAPQLPMPGMPPMPQFPGMPAPPGVPQPPGGAPPRPPPPTFNQNQQLDDLIDDRGGVSLNANTRAQLMARLARDDAPQPPPPSGPPSGGGDRVAPSYPAGAAAAPPPPAAGGGPPSECLVLRNMFDPRTETDPDFAQEIQEETAEEARKFGPLRHCYVDPHHPDGLVYLRFGTTGASQSAQSTFNGRFFAGKQIVATFMDPQHYSTRFPSS